MRNIDIEKETKTIVKFINTIVKISGFKKVVVGLSGGVDSSVATALAVRALGRENVFVLLLPYKNKNQEATKLSWALANQLNIPKNHVFEIDIAPIIDAFRKNVIARMPIKSADEAIFLNQLDKLRLGNVMARVRMIILFDFAKKNHTLVLGTENKTEHILGYFTRYGDEASDMEPIRHLYKTEVFALAKYLQLPEQIINQTPTAGLWPGQTDEGEFGFTYREADEIIYSLFEAKKPVTELIKQGINKNTINKVKAWIDKTSFKHKMPYKI